MFTEDIQLPLTNKNFDDLTTKYKSDALGFAEDILCRTWDDWQKDTLRAASDPSKKRVARSAAHGVGKSWVAGAIALWRLVCLPESQIICTAATFPQLMTRFFPTIKKLAEASIIRDWFDMSAETILVKGVKRNWLKAQAWNRANSESFAGLHIYAPCLIADEASAIWEEVFRAFEGSMQHERSFMLLLGNPLYREGKLFDAFHKEKHLWDLYSISGYDSSYVPTDWLEDMKKLHGADSDVFKVRCLGLFPSQNLESWISEQSVLDSFNRNITQDITEYACNAALDVAFARDRSVFTIRRGPQVLMTKIWREREPEDLIFDVIKLIEDHGVDKIAIDALGPGYPIATAIAKKHPDKVQFIKYSEAAQNKEMYGNLRAEAWGAIKDWLQYGKLCGEVQDWIIDLTSPSYHYDGKGRYLIEKKDELRKRGLPSTDMADSLGMNLLLSDVKPQPRRALGNRTRNAYSGDWTGI